MCCESDKKERKAQPKGGDASSFGKKTKKGIGKEKIVRHIAAYVLTRPACLVLWWASWHCLCALCRYGRVYRNGSLLLVCLILWICVLIYGIFLTADYRKGGCRRACVEKAAGGALFLVEDKEDKRRPSGGDGGREQNACEFDGEAVKWYVREGGSLRLFLKTGEVLLLDLHGQKPEEQDLLELKLSAVEPVRRAGFRRFAAVVLLVTALWGSILVAESAMPYNGKLAWYLKDLRDKRTVTLVSDNVYETGVDGILEDIRRKVDLPQTLCLATSFNLHFALDGTVQSLDTMLYGFDEEGNFTGSYLVSYDAARSRKMSIYLHGAEHAQFQVKKDLQPLVEAVRVMPLEESVSRWSDSYDSFGILYYGVREWPGGQGVRFINHYGECWDPPVWERNFDGYSISLFCPDVDNAPSQRYLYMGYRTPPGTPH